MKNIYLLGLLVLFCAVPIKAQETQVHQVDVQTYGPVPAGYQYLNNTNTQIRGDFMLNEMLVDLVSVGLTDSILPRDHERHQFFGAGLLRLIGLRWDAITGKKEKFVGTTYKHVRIPGSELLTEYDVNWDIAPHMGKYINLAYQGYMTQMEIGRAKKKNNYYEGPPYVYPDGETNMKKYHLHCELSPPKEYRPMLDNQFYPCISGSNMTDHPNFGEEGVSLGLYGAFCSDCNHSCHPEIHPYEWIWWLNLNPEREDEYSKQWVFGLFREGSNRFPKWSPAPRTGEISIPFTIPAGVQSLDINLEHLVYDCFSQEKLEELIAIPEQAITGLETEHEFQVVGSSNKIIRLHMNEPLFSKGWRLWLDQINYDELTGVMTGKIRIAVSVHSLYTAKVTFN